MIRIDAHRSLINQRDGEYPGASVNLIPIGIEMVDTTYGSFGLLPHVIVNGAPACAEPETEVLTINAFAPLVPRIRAAVLAGGSARNHY